jgi:hypothetical protein
MAGILANSASVSMASGTLDNTTTGFVVGEQVALTAPSGTLYAWSWSLPSGSAPARSALSATDVRSPSFTPDVAGIYTLVCDVDGTVYLLRVAVTMRATSTVTQALRFTPVPDAAVAAPVVGVALYFSSDANALVTKDPSGTIVPV